MIESVSEQAQTFALEIMETLAKVLPDGDLGMELVQHDRVNNFILRCAEESGIALKVDGKIVMRMELDFTLGIDGSGVWLKVISSSFAFVPENKGIPFFRYDFLADSHTAPNAHINVHAHRDDLIEALLSSSKTQTAKKRREAFLKAGKLPKLANFHFPVGGKRFRPSWEEVLHTVIEEFALDRRESTWESALKEGQFRHFERQLTSAVADDPKTAISALEMIGYRVTKTI